MLAAFGDTRAGPNESGQRLFDVVVGETRGGGGRGVRGGEEVREEGQSSEGEVLRGEGQGRQEAGKQRRRRLWVRSFLIRSGSVRRGSVNAPTAARSGRGSG